jgi:hypothetical protein
MHFQQLAYAHSVDILSAVRSGRERFVEGAAVPAVLAVAALIAVLPHLLIGFPSGHSVNVNIFWHDSFSEQLLSGEPLPRWLFSYWGGLGAPVFYFYAPFPFYLFTLIELFPVDQWGEFAVMSLGHALLFFLSGAAFYALARRFTDRFWGTAIAIAYMFAPYHYIDIEIRAAIGEACAYIWIPLILIGVWRPDKTWRSTVLAACAYAGLALSHLPSALLAAPAIGLFSILSSERAERLRAVGHALVVGVLGVVLSAFYVLPALTLRDTISHDAWVIGQGFHFVATRWLIGSPHLQGFGRLIYELLGGTTAVGVGFWLAHVALRKSRFGGELEAPSKLLTQPIVAVLCLCWFLMSGLAWPLWEYLPILPQVQFPWRLGVVVDVCSFLLIVLFAPSVIRCIVTGFEVSPPRRKAAELGVCALALGILSAAVMLEYFPSPVGAKNDIPGTLAPVEYRAKWLVESPAYLGSKDAADLHDIRVAPQTHEKGVRRWEKSIKRLPSIAAQRSLDLGESVSMRSDAVTQTRISAVLDSAATIRVKKVYYPHWRLTNSEGEEVAVHPDDRTGLLTFELPQGRHELTLDRRIFPVELAGMFVSLLALLGILLARLVFRVGGAVD